MLLRDFWLEEYNFVPDGDETKKILAGFEHPWIKLRFGQEKSSYKIAEIIQFKNYLHTSSSNLILKSLFELGLRTGKSLLATHWIIPIWRQNYKKTLTFVITTDSSYKMYKERIDKEKKLNIIYPQNTIFDTAQSKTKHFMHLIADDTLSVSGLAQNDFTIFTTAQWVYSNLELICDYTKKHLGFELLIIRDEQDEGGTENDAQKEKDVGISSKLENYTYTRNLEQLSQCLPNSVVIGLTGTTLFSQENLARYDNNGRLPSLVDVVRPDGNFETIFIDTDWKTVFTEEEYEENVKSSVGQLNNLAITKIHQVTKRKVEGTNKQTFDVNSLPNEEWILGNDNFNKDYRQKHKDLSLRFNKTYPNEKNIFPVVPLKFCDFIFAGQGGDKHQTTSYAHYIEYATKLMSDVDKLKKSGDLDLDFNVLFIHSDNKILSKLEKSLPGNPSFSQELDVDDLADKNLVVLVNKGSRAFDYSNIRRVFSLRAAKRINSKDGYAPFTNTLTQKARMLTLSTGLDSDKFTSLDDIEEFLKSHLRLSSNFISDLKDFVWNNTQAEYHTISFVGDSDPTGEYVFKDLKRMIPSKEDFENKFNDTFGGVDLEEEEICPCCKSSNCPEWIFYKHKHIVMLNRDTEFDSIEDALGVTIN